MIEISKELLSEVLNVEISEVNGTLTHKNNKSLLSYTTKNCSINDGKELINIYELAHKCKEWIINNGYVLKICYVLENDTRDLAFIETTLLKSNQYLSDYYDMDSKTEIEAVIKACQGILDNEDSK